MATIFLELLKLVDMILRKMFLFNIKNFED